MTIVGGIEGGGTKIVCGIGDENGQVIGRSEFLTTSPEETLDNIAAYNGFRDWDI